MRAVSAGVHCFKDPCGQNFAYLPLKMRKHRELGKLFKTQGLERDLNLWLFLGKCSWAALASIASLQKRDVLRLSGAGEAEREYRKKKGPCS